MTHAIEWHPEAELEFSWEIDWYQDQQPGLGDRFEDNVLNAVDSSADTPDAWPPWPGWSRVPLVRSKGVNGFPYRVIYFIEEEMLTHRRRRPLEAPPRILARPAPRIQFVTRWIAGVSPFVACIDSWIWWSVGALPVDPYRAT